MGDASQLERLLTLLWDLGLKIGHSVRSVDECIGRRARRHHPDQPDRGAPAAGDGAAAAGRRSGIARSTCGRRKSSSAPRSRSRTLRHAKYADTEYSLEPNIKGSPGGLRDLQLIGWLARRHFGWRKLQELTDNRFLTEAEATTILHGQEFLWRVRYALHMITGREEDRLLFDHQRELARIWGFKDGDKLAVEQFMQLYYRWALALSQLNEVLILSFDQAMLQADGRDEHRRHRTSTSSCATATSAPAATACSASIRARCWRSSSTPAITRMRGHLRADDPPDPRAPPPDRRCLPQRPGTTASASWPCCAATSA
jgi:[protein-PII] uridylyltransferase